MPNRSWAGCKKDPNTKTKSKKGAQLPYSTNFDAFKLPLGGAACFLNVRSINQYAVYFITNQLRLAF